jgi:hypothetical protein
MALALRRYVAGRISNDDLDRVDVDWRDRGTVAVKQMAWRLYSDTRNHYAIGKHAITDDGKGIIARWVVFLHTDSEYLWPEYSFIQIVNWPLDLLTFGWWERRKNLRRKQFEEAGDFSVWPFIHVTDSARAARRPRYFAGGRTR